MRSQIRLSLAIVALFALGGVLPVSLSRAGPSGHPQSDGYALRFYGNGVNDIDRVKIRIDDPANSDPGPPADVGATDFTLEFWMKAGASENGASAVTCGWNINWIYGNIVFDRDRFSQDRKFGLSIAGGAPVFGVSGDGTGDFTICGTTNVLDEQWHHVAVQRRRSDGRMWLYVDGSQETQADGPDGDISYPDDGVPGDYCDGPCTNSDPYLVIGAEKHDAGSAYPSYSGWIDEVRLSNVLRYSGSFTPASQPFTPDANATALYHFDEGSGDTIGDSSGAAGGPSNGERKYGGSPLGPVWTTDTPFSAPDSHFTLSAAPPSQAIDPGGVATYTLSVQPIGGFSATVTLIAVSPSPSLTLTLAPVAVDPPGQATLTITDAHTGPLLPGLWYTVPITATGGDTTQTASAGLMVGGARVYLPLILRDYP